MTTDKEQEFPIQKDTPFFDGRIDLVFINAQGLCQLIRSKYIKDMSRSQRQQDLNSTLNRESIRKKYLEKE
ncbi:TPA: hypothetical protein ENX78_18090 [Candidatus Poribacteria bacterium]|nr:hypothetical protein [Candidatus Poribacteria bacterium]